MGITNNTREKRKKTNKSIKKKSEKKNNRISNIIKKIDKFRYYSNNFKGTKYIPVTKIINYMKQHYHEYDAQKQITLDDLFNFNNGLRTGSK